MKKITIWVFIIAISPVHLGAHDTFLKFKNHFLEPESKVTVSLMNGTIDESENNVAVARMQDVRIVGPNQRIQRLDNNQWKLTEKLSKLGFTTGEPGTYVAGVSIKPRNLEMSADEFNKYLKHSGVTDVLNERQKNELADEKVVERYSKHVKAVFQVGEKRTASFRQTFDYPIEIVPQANPFSVSVGDILPVQINFRGNPVSNQLVYASYVGFHEHDDDGQHIEAVQTRTDAEGIAKIKITQNGVWYLRLIHMFASKEDGIDYESNWATITFEIK